MKEQFIDSNIDEFKIHLEPWIQEGILLVSMEDFDAPKVQLTEINKRIGVKEGYDLVFETFDKIQ